jgi:hypothetical protein
VAQKSLQQVEEIPKLKIQIHKKKERMNMKMLSTSVADPLVFGPPGSGSGSISQRYGSGSFYYLFINKQKYSKYYLYSYCFVTSFGLFIFEK